MGFHFWDPLGDLGHTPSTCTVLACAESDCTTASQVFTHLAGGFEGCYRVGFRDVTG